MNNTAVSTFSKITFAGAIALLSVSQAVASDRAEVLERISPVGKVAVEGQTAPSVVAEQDQTPAIAVEPAAPEAAAPAVADAVTPAAAPAAPAAVGGDALALATSSGCMGCHQVEMKVVGPSYKDVAAKYKSDTGAVDMLAAKVKAGGAGTWGQIPMPPNGHVSDENIRTIVEWVMTL